MLRPVHALLYLATALTFSLAATAQTAPPLQSAEALGQDLYVRSGSTGLVLLVVRGNEVFFRGYGETAIGSGQTPAPDSLIRLCSLSKIFATDLFLKLAADKIVRLDTPLQHLAAPNKIVPSRNGHVITLGDLATHTAGLPREVHPAPSGVPHFTFPDYQQRWAWLPKQHLLSVPGTAALYSNAGFDLLGDALQTAAGKPYPTLIAERTTTPLGMHETSYDPTPNQCARLLQGAHDEGPCTSTDATAASSGLYSTPRDMVQWLKYLLGTGTPQIPRRPRSRKPSTSSPKGSCATRASTTPANPRASASAGSTPSPRPNPHPTRSSKRPVAAQVSSPTSRSTSRVASASSSPPPMAASRRISTFSAPPTTCSSRSPACPRSHPSRHAPSA